MKFSSKPSCTPVRLAYCAATAAGTFMLFSAAGAEAAPVTIGQVAPGTTPPPISCVIGPFDGFQPAVTSGSSYVVPSGGTRITSWSTYAAEGAGQMLTLKVFRQVSGSTYKVVGHDGPRELSPGVLNTFPTDITVEAGDVIGNNDDNASKVTPSACTFAAPGDANVYAPTSNLADGESANFTEIEKDFRLNDSAVVALLPGISSIGPSSGSIVGNSSIVINGHDFTGATAVKFGATPASYSVNSDTQITAIAPPSTAPGMVDTSVTTVAGTSPAGASDQFAYTACIVPKLKGKKLKTAKKGLLKADCKLGKVKGKRNSAAKVVIQKPKPGTVLAVGSKVNVTVK